MTDLVLASASAARQRLMRAAGLEFRIEPAAIDERAAEEPLVKAGARAADIALALAAAKAILISEKIPSALVIGTDQVLEHQGNRYNKPESFDEARRQLLALSGSTHQLHSAVAVAEQGAIVWDHSATAHLTMRLLRPEEIGRYLADLGDQALQSVGAYQIEGLGIRLFDRIDGDYFTILGLPMLPLLGYLRQRDLIE